MTRAAPPRPKRWPFWCLSTALIVAGPVLTDLYWGQLLASGALSTDADSIGIPILLRLIANLAAAPVVLGLTWLALRGYGRWGGLLSWRRDRPLFSLAVSLPLCGAAGWIAAAMVADLLARREEAMPWYGKLQYLDPALILAWLLILRALALSPRLTRPCGLPRSGERLPASRR